MPPKDAAAQGAPGGGDRLSGLRDEILLRVMGHLKAWEAVRTCALSTRWRNLWASASRLDIRHPWPCCLLAADDQVPVVEAFAAADQVLAETFAVADQVLAETFAAFVKNLLLRRLPLAQLDSLRLCWSHEAPDGNANFWIAYAVRHGAEEIELSAEHHFPKPSPQYMRFIVDGDEDANYRLKILKLIHVRLGGTTLTQLCSRCTCLEELELKDCQILEAPEIRSTMLKCLTMIRCQIRKGLSVHAPNLVALQFSRNFWHVPWIQNLGLLAASNIYLQAPHKYNIYLQAPHKYTECSDLSSCNLKILKLSCVKLDDTTLEQLYSRCTSLEELELIDCSVVGKKIQSTSLRCLTMIDCKFAIGSWVNVPNLLSLRCTRPFQQVPCFWNMKFLVTAIIALDDSCIPSDSWWTWADDHKDESDHDGDFFAHSRAEDSDDNGEFFDNESNHFFEYSGAEDSDDNGEFFEHSGAEDSDVNSDNESDPNEEDESGIDGAHSGAEESDDNIDVGIEKSGDDNDDESYLNDNTFAHAGAEDSDENHGSGPGDEVDGCTVRYDEIAEEYNGDCGGMFGGYGMLCSLSNVRKMALSAHSGEVLLMRESKLCPDFKNLKTLSLGEWCITPDFDILARVLQSSPNLENLFVHLDMANKSRVDFDKRASLFVSTNLKKVEITCCKHNKMVDILAELFRVNIVTNKKVFVHHTACTCDVNRGTGSQAKRKAQTEAKKRPVKQIRPGN